MDDTLKRLLDAELRAEALVDEAKVKREAIIRQALEEAHHGELQFSERIPAIHGTALGKAKARAAQTIGQLQRHYDERKGELRHMAEEHKKQAIEAALSIILDPEKG